MEKPVNRDGSIVAERYNELLFVPEAAQLGKTVARLCGGRTYFTVTDENVARSHPEILPKTDVLVLPAGEDGKTLMRVENICRAMLSAGLTRKSVLVAVGGGVIGDLTGFAASVYMRGVDFLNVPTTLLSQVDSAIGGKTGVNLDGYKNMIGAFHMPRHIVICPEVLASLPQREWICGMGELVKTAFLDEELYAYVRKNISALTAREQFAVEKAVRMAATYKRGVTDRDPTEQGERMFLNLGHTVGHALEKCDDHRLSHGEYVLLGLKIELYMARKSRMAHEPFLREADDLLAAVGLPKLPNISVGEVSAAAKSDKKNADGKITLLGVMTAGSPYICKFTEKEFARDYAQAVETFVQKGELSIG